ncbi:hypothetical protein ACFC07_22415 [Streptomyces sp. NPDC056099]|uniref:hypothetical protein n=1 Tax=unclassified Streptomyces TaxID=2593676 RepID=UPI0035E1E684
MIVRTLPLTLRWHAMFYRGGSRFAAGPIRTHEDGHPRTIGATLTIARFTIGIAQFGPTHLRATVKHWYRDFGRRFGRFSIGGWRSFGVPVSTGWVRGGDRRLGITATLCSRTIYVVRMWTAAEYQEALEQRR